jgi:hypothetical protein
VCEEILTATKGWGANKQKVINALATRDASDRYKVALRYKELHHVELSEVMKKEFSGDLGMALKLLALPLDWAECAMIRKATAGIGASTNILWSVLCGRTNEEIDRIKKVYFKKYDQDLGQVLASELRGQMERVIFNCLQGAEEVYDPHFHTDDKAEEDAESIQKMGQGRWGTDEKGIFKIVCAAPKEHLENVNKFYADKFGYTIPKALEKELGGLMESGTKSATLHMVGMKLKPYETIAKLIKSTGDGIGTDEFMLTCTLIRYQGVMQDVMSAYIELYGSSIHDFVRKEAGGKYKEVLLQILNTVWPEEG